MLEREGKREAGVPGGGGIICIYIIFWRAPTGNIVAIFEVESTGGRIIGPTVTKTDVDVFRTVHIATVVPHLVRALLRRGDLETDDDAVPSIPRNGTHDDPLCRIPAG